MLAPAKLSTTKRSFEKQEKPALDFDWERGVANFSMLVSRMIRLTNRTLLTKRYFVRSDDKLTDSLQRGSCDARKCGRELGESLHDRRVGRARDLQLPNKAFGPHQFQ